MKKIIITLTILLLSFASFSQKMIKFAMSGGTYQMGSVVIITPNAKDAANYVRTYLDSTVTEKDFEAQGMVFFIEGYRPIMWLPRVPENIQDVSIAAHELFHLAACTMIWARIPLNETTEEAYAHMVQYLTHQFYTKLGIK